MRVKLIITAIFARGSAAAGSVVLAIVLTRVAGIEILGAFTILTTICSSMIIFAKGGYDTAYLREGSRIIDDGHCDDRARVFKNVINCVFSNSLLAFLITIFFCVVYIFVSTNFSFLGGLLIATTVISFSLTALCAEYFKAKSRAEIAILFGPGTVSLVAAFLLYALHVNFQQLVAYSTLIGGVYSFSGVVVLIIALLVVSKDKVIASVGVNNSLVPQDIEKNMRHINASKGDFFWSQLYTFMGFGGLFLIAGVLFDGSDVGLIRLAERLAAPVALILSIVNPLIASKLSRFYQQERLTELIRLVRATGIICSALAVVLVVLGGLYSTQLVQSLGLGSDDVTSVLMIMLFGNGINLAFGPLGLVLSMTNHEKELRKISRLNMKLAIVSAILFGLAFGAIGFCSALSLSFFLKNALMYRVYHTCIKNKAA